MRKRKKQYGTLIILDIIISIVDILALALLLWIIQFYIQPGDKNHAAFLPHGLADGSSVTFIAIFLVLFGIKNGLGFLISRAHFKFISRVAIRISRTSLSNYQQSKFSEFVNIDSSAHIRNICFQPFDFCQYVLSGVQQIITQTALILLTIIAIIIFDAKLFMLLLIILLPPVIIVFYFIKKKLTVAKNIQATNEKSFRYVLDAIKGYVESNIYNRNEFFLQRFIKARQQFSNHLFGSLALQSMPNRIIEVFAVLGLFILIVIAKWTENHDSNTLITIGAFMAAAYKIIPGLVKVINISGQMKAYEFSLNDLEQNKNTAEHPTEPGVVNAIKSIELKNINFQYGGHEVLRNFSLLIRQGDFIGITGESGKGKTTLLNLLLGFLSPATCDIFINGLPVASNDIKNHWPFIAYVRQQNFFIHDTLLRNITLEEEGYDEKKFHHAFQVSGLDKVITKFPEGLNKIITENGKNISGGQQQRIAIARALYKNAPLILLDEPFNELDEEATYILLEHFRDVALAGKSVVMITHDKKAFHIVIKSFR